jgi:predicted esterase
MPPRIPTEADFEPLSPALHLALHFPSPREATTSILILFHGLGDHELPFANFARSLNLPGVLAVSVRGTATLPAPFAADDGSGPSTSYPQSHWGDDLALDPATGELDDDPGFEAARKLVMERLVGETLLERCGWEMSDVMLFGFGQGGSLALGLASKLRSMERVVDVTDEPKATEQSTASSQKGGKAFKGVISIGGPLPPSMVPSLSSAAAEKSRTSVLVCQLDGDKAAFVKREFEDVTVVKWKRSEVAMPRDREEVFPLMKFFADCLNRGW